jgi:predicted transcriptional regulator
MSKKQTLVAKSIELLKVEPNISVSDMAARLGVTVQRTYALRNYVKTKHVKKAGSQPTTTVKQDVNKIIKGLEVEIAKYHQWCLDWRGKHDALQDELEFSRSALLDAKAVIKYLEGKI